MTRVLPLQTRDASKQDSKSLPELPDLDAKDLPVGLSHQFVHNDTHPHHRKHHTAHKHVHHSLSTNFLDKQEDEIEKRLREIGIDSPQQRPRTASLHHASHHHKAHTRAPDSIPTTTLHKDVVNAHPDPVPQQVEEVLSPPPVAMDPKMQRRIELLVQFGYEVADTDKPTAQKVAHELQRILVHETIDDVHKDSIAKFQHLVGRGDGQ